jgi:hypothetical protein
MNGVQSDTRHASTPRLRRFAQRERRTFSKLLVPTVFVLILGFLLAFGRPSRATLFSFETLLWASAIAGVVTFLLTFSGRFKKWLMGGQ